MRVIDLKLGDKLYWAKLKCIGTHSISALRILPNQLYVEVTYGKANNTIMCKADSESIGIDNLFMTLKEAQEHQEKLRAIRCKNLYDDYVNAKKMYEEAIELLKSPISEEPTNIEN